MGEHQMNDDDKAAKTDENPDEFRNEWAWTARSDVPMTDLVRIAQGWKFPLGLCVATRFDDAATDALRGEALRMMRDGDASLARVAAYCDVATWRTRRDARLDGAGVPTESFVSWHVVIPIRGAHDALRRCLETLADLDDADAFDLTLVCHESEFAAVHAIAENAMGNCAPWFHVEPTLEQCGFARACNTGLDYRWDENDVVVFLNSDTDLSRLYSLRGAFGSAIALADAAGPAGTNVSGFQSVGSPADGKLSDLRAPHVFRVPYPRLVGFCLAVRFGTFLSVGGWDEGYTNAYDDDDLSLRMALTSTPGSPSLLWTPCVVVLHEGSASFRELPDAQSVYDRAMRENRARFDARWGWALPEIPAWWRSL